MSEEMKMTLFTFVVGIIIIGARILMNNEDDNYED